MVATKAKTLRIKYNQSSTFTHSNHDPVLWFHSPNFAFMYRLLKPLLFKMPAERAHALTFSALNLASQVPGILSLLQRTYRVEAPALEQQVFGLQFKNPVGLAAGLDKNAEHLHGLKALGFGFIEIGTVTPRPQRGNPQPRLFRLPMDEALINRMGFNNDGVEVVARRLEKRPKDLIVGGNIGKNKITPNKLAVADYKTCFERLYNLVDYFVVNVSSPNTPGLRELQQKEPLKKLLSTLQEVNAGKAGAKPLLLKVAPDLTATQLEDIVDIAVDTALDGLIVTNTSTSREKLQTPKSRLDEIGEGGLSGKPVFEMSTSVLSFLKAKLGSQVPLIGVGGIMNGADAKLKLDAGAHLVQIYTGLIYKGPGLVKAINKHLQKQPIA